MIKRRKAVVAEEPGVTRDRNYHQTSWNRKSFYLVDTGGLDPTSKEQMTRMVRFQTDIAIQEADMILFLVDFKVGWQSLELEIAKQLRKTQKKVVVIANKADRAEDADRIQEIRRLGLGEPWAVSAINGLGVAELMDYVASELPEKVEANALEGISIAVVGRPNVGKSSFVNTILGQEKLIVSEIPGTTRDSIDTQVEFEGEKFILIDTAGLRHKTKDKDELEYYTSLRTLRAVKECDVAALLIEAPQGPVKQDLRIAQDILQSGKGLMLVVNKWDLVEKTSDTADEYKKFIQQKVSFLSFVPLLFVSSKSGQRVARALPLAKQIHLERQKRIETSQLNDKIGADIDRHPPPALKGKYIKIYYITQVDTEPPEIVCFSNYPELIKDSYKQFLENRIREHFGFEGVPLRIKLKKRH
jgi:GTP-binding protein